MKQKKPKFYFCEIYRARIYYFIGWSNDEMVAYAKRKLDWEIEPTNGVGSCHSLEWNEKHYLAIWSKKSNDVFTVAHECLHAANFIMRRIGASPDDEPQAYLFDEIFKKAFE